MIEMRWLTRTEDEPISTGVYGWAAGKTVLTQKVVKRVLQYRQKIDTNVYAGLGIFGTIAPNKQWSEWVDVKEVPLEDS